MNSSWTKLLDKLTGWLDSIIINIPNLILASLVMLFAFLISKYLNKWLSKYLKKVIRQPSIRSLILNTVTFVLLTIGLLLSLSVLNLDDMLTSILAGAGVAGLAISLALQGTLSNTFSGIYLAVKDIIEVGDFIETNGYSGTVEEINLRNIKLRESDNNIVILPNKAVLNEPFKNMGLTKRARVTINCGISYSSNLEKVRTLTISQIETLFPPKEGEKIEFFYREFGGSSIDFMLRFWVNSTAKISALEAKSIAIEKLNTTFIENDISIPFPTRTLVKEF